MRVHVSPWETTSTSLRAPADKRRRRHDGQIDVAANFVPNSSRTTRAKKARGATDDVLPTLVITGDHRVVVVGNSSDQLVRESAVLNYSSRPVQSSTFVSSESSVGALLDSKNERFFALQMDNQRLVSWPISSGPDEAVGLDLKHEAQDLALFVLPSGRGYVYGGCSDGSAFLASFENEKLHIDYVDCSSVDQQENLRRVGTFMSASFGGSPDPVGTKRKAEEVSSLILYQMFYVKSGLLLSRIEIPLIRDSSHGVIPGEVHWTSIPVVDENTNTAVNTVESLGSAEDDTIVIVYGTKTTYDTDENPRNGDHMISKYCVRVSLALGDVVGSPTALPDRTHQVAAVGSNMLAVKSEAKELLFVDLVRGGYLLCESLAIDLTESEACMLVGDPNQPRLALLHFRGDVLHVQFASVSIDSDSNVQGKRGKLCLAAGLAASQSLGPSRLSVPRSLLSRSILAFDDELGLNSSKTKAQIELAVAWLDKKLSSVVDCMIPPPPASYLFDTYEHALKLLSMRPTSSPVQKSTLQTINDNPQDAIPSSKEELLNGTHAKPGTGKFVAAKNGVSELVGVKNGISKVAEAKLNGTIPHKLSNGLAAHQAPRAITPSGIPQEVIDCAISHVVRILCLQKVEGLKADAQVLLRRLVRTCKVSARARLSPSNTKGDSLDQLLQSLEQKAGEDASGYTPVEFAFDLFRCCSDVSERQIAAVFHYLLSRAQPFEIASFFCRSKKIAHDHACKAFGNRFLLLQSKNDDAAKLKTMSHQMILVGASMFLSSVNGCSDFNESLLHTAVAESLSRTETFVLARLLLHSLTSRKWSLHRTNADMQRRTIQWLSVLTDCVRGPFTESEMKEISHIQRAIGTEISKTESIVALQDHVSDAGLGSASEAVGYSAMDKKEPKNALPAYSIERLVF